MQTLLTLITAAVLALAPHGDDPKPQDIVETAVSAGSFDTLAAALTAAGLVETLQGEGPYTVFAPTDEAFAQLPQETLQALLRPANKTALTSVLSYHVVAGEVSAQQAIAAGKSASLQGNPIAFRIEEGRLRANEANVITNDIACTNGVIHVIDSVLLPPGGLDLRPAGRLIIGVHFEKPSRSLAEQLQIDPNKSLLLTGISAGGPSERAGLRKYDIITAVDGQPATDASVKHAKERVGQGGQLHLSIIRRGEPMQVTVKVELDPH